jgi:3-dehydroquinate dehydratase-2
VPRIVLLNGPNLNRLGSREPEVYGTQTLADVEALVTARASELGWSVAAFQSNHEGALIDRVHQAADDGVDGIVINPGALSHYSYALYDALEAVPVPAVEVHISDIDNREAWRRTSVTAPACVGVVKGKGVKGYLVALDLLAEHVEQPAREEAR